MAEKICFLLDDDDDDCEIFQLALKQITGFTCVTSHNAKDALKKLSDDAFKPDFIFLDLNMPLMSGYECLKEIRKIQKLDNTPICIYTTSSQHADKVTLMKLGATCFVTKPTKVSILVETLTKILYA